MPEQIYDRAAITEKELEEKLDRAAEFWAELFIAQIDSENLTANSDIK